MITRSTAAYSRVALALLLALTGCTNRNGPVEIDPPNPGAAARRACEQLAPRLADSLGKGLSRRPTRPESPLVAAWGSPAAVLRCGVPIEPEFKTGDQVIEIERDGTRVGWFAVRRRNKAVWSTPLATVHVELTIPDEYQGAGLLARLTPAVSKVGVF